MTATDRKGGARALAEQARAFGVAPDEFPDQAALKRRVQEAARYASKPRIALVFALCAAAVAGCALAAWLSMYLLGLR